MFSKKWADIEDDDVRVTSSDVRWADVQDDDVAPAAQKVGRVADDKGIR